MSMIEILNELPRLGEHECQTLFRRLVELDKAIPPPCHPRANPLAALNFAREHGLEERNAADWMKRLRYGEED